jgi:hypothetical protein
MRVVKRVTKKREEGSRGVMPECLRMKKSALSGWRGMIGGRTQRWRTEMRENTHRRAKATGEEKLESCYLRPG